MRIVIDTSSLIYLIEKRIDPSILAEHTIFVTYPVLDELQTLSIKRRKARVALKLLRVMAPFVAGGAGPADRSVVAAAEMMGGAVLSGDDEVVEEARRRGLAVLLFHDKELVSL